MEYEVGKINAAVDQLDWAIRLFLDHQAYVPAITLAGAAEEVLGESLGDKAAFRIMRSRLSSEHGIDPETVSRNYLNRTKNWLKHWKNQHDPEVTTVELETEAISYILRAVANLASHDQSATSETPRFFDWLQANRQDLRGQTTE